MGSPIKIEQRLNGIWPGHCQTCTISHLTNNNNNSKNIMLDTDQVYWVYGSSELLVWEQLPIQQVHPAKGGPKCWLFMWVPDKIQLTLSVFHCVVAWQCFLVFVPFVVSSHTIKSPLFVFPPVLAWYCYLVITPLVLHHLCLLVFLFYKM